MAKNAQEAKRYSVSKMFSLPQKLKIPKRCEKQLYHHIRVVVRTKPPQKTPNIQTITAF